MTREYIQGTMIWRENDFRCLRSTKGSITTRILRAWLRKPSRDPDNVRKLDRLKSHEFAVRKGQTVDELKQRTLNIIHAGLIEQFEENRLTFVPSESFEYSVARTTNHWNDSEGLDNTCYRKLVRTQDCFYLSDQTLGGRESRKVVLEDLKQGTCTYINNLEHPFDTLLLTLRILQWYELERNETHDGPLNRLVSTDLD